MSNVCFTHVKGYVYLSMKQSFHLQLQYLAEALIQSNLQLNYSV